MFPAQSVRVDGDGRAGYPPPGAIPAFEELVAGRVLKRLDGFER
ncbi:hypothetical protein D187_003892 [Cystobacter fuscus DSM 2262]|uniref:Uncharacterized protein n=1 Tax=Cystobacter fuscus (strain ATCC 25194 / DSM 2262 / NBRC 100088 / M29) TaxID=1242864 RepID=S9P1R9_CYSF2|nr:hypothetical protein D187_003892 [Cystobacter fuscus DSM 2262]